MNLTEKQLENIASFAVRGQIITDEMLNKIRSIDGVFDANVTHRIDNSGYEDFYFQCDKAKTKEVIFEISKIIDYDLSPLTKHI
jgi:hypothetical protein